MSNKGIQLIEEETALELQHVNIKLLLNNPADLDVHALVPVFHGWIQQQSTEELLLDVASYAHVKDGPGILLIGHEADYSLDFTDGRLGFRYNRKAAIEGNNQGRLEQAATAALKALAKLEQDERLDGKVRFDRRNIELFVNDRWLAPNNEETRRAAEPELRAFLDHLLAGGTYSLAYETEPRRLFRVRVQFEREFTTAELLYNLIGSAGQRAGL
jgi:hypothetical protein